MGEPSQPIDNGGLVECLF